jgi:hypothetical protein
LLHTNILIYSVSSFYAYETRCTGVYSYGLQGGGAALAGAGVGALGVRVLISWLLRL